MNNNHMSIKDTYIKLTENLGGPYTLIKRGIKRSVICSIMEGKDVRISNVCKVAKALNVPISTLIEEKKEIKEKKEQYFNTQFSFLNKFEILTEEEKELLEKTMKVMRGYNRDNANALKSNIRAFYKTHNYEDKKTDSKKTTQQVAHIKKQKAG